MVNDSFLLQSPRRKSAFLASLDTAQRHCSQQAWHVIPFKILDFFPYGFSYRIFQRDTDVSSVLPSSPSGEEGQVRTAHYFPLRTFAAANKTGHPVWRSSVWSLGTQSLRRSHCDGDVWIIWGLFFLFDNGNGLTWQISTWQPWAQWRRQSLVSCTTPGVILIVVVVVTIGRNTDNCDHYIPLVTRASYSNDILP